MKYGKRNFLPLWASVCLVSLLGVQAVKAVLVSGATVTVNWTGANQDCAQEMRIQHYNSGSTVLIHNWIVPITTLNGTWTSPAFDADSTDKFGVLKTASFPCNGFGYIGYTGGVVPSKPNLVGDLDFTLGENQDGWRGTYYFRHKWTNDQDFSREIEYSIQNAAGVYEIQGSAIDVAAHTENCIVLGPFDHPKPIHVSINSVLYGIPVDIAMECPTCGANWYSSVVTCAAAGTTTPPVITPPGTVPGAGTTVITYPGTEGLALDSTLRAGFDAVVAQNDSWRYAQMSALAGLDIKLGILKDQGDATAIFHGQQTTRETALKVSIDKIQENTYDANLNIVSLKDSVGVKLNAVNDNLDAIADKIDTSNSQLGGINTKLAADALVQASIKAELTNAKDLIGVGNTKLGEIKGVLETGNMELVSQNTKLGSINDGIDNVNTRLADLQGKGADLNILIEQMVAGQESGNGKLDTIASKLGQIKTSIEDGNADLSDLLREGNDTANNINGTLGGISNGVMEVIQSLQALTNAIGAKKTGSAEQARVDELVEEGVAASVSVKGDYDGLINGLGTMPSLNIVNGHSIFQMEMMPGMTVDLDPLTSSRFAPVIAALRQFVSWVVTFIFIMACWRCAEEHIRSTGSVQQAQAVRSSVLGNDAGIVTGIPYAAAIMAALVAVPAFAVAWMNSHGMLGMFGSNPLAPFTSIGGVLYLLDGFFPLGQILTDLGLYVAFRLGISSVYFVSVTIVRFIFS